jgi:hypothetical protein
VVLADINENDVPLADDTIELGFLSLVARPRLIARRQEVIGGNRYGPQELAIEFVRFPRGAHRDGGMLEELRENNGSVASLRCWLCRGRAYASQWESDEQEREV